MTLEAVQVALEFERLPLSSVVLGVLVERNASIALPQLRRAVAGADLRYTITRGLVESSVASLIYEGLAEWDLSAGSVRVRSTVHGSRGPG